MRTGRSSTSNRRSFLLSGATLAGAAMAPAFAVQSRESSSMVQLAQASGTAATAPASAITVKSVERLAGSANSFAYAVKAGPWISAASVRDGASAGAAAVERRRRRRRLLDLRGVRRPPQPSQRPRAHRRNPKNYQAIIIAYRIIPPFNLKRLSREMKVRQGRQRDANGLIESRDHPR